MLAIALSTKQDTDNVLYLKHVASTYIGALLKSDNPESGIVPKGVTWVVAADLNAILLKGPADKVKEARQVIMQFDIEPMKLHIVGYVELPRLKRSWVVDTTVYNNQPWSLTDGQAGLTMSVCPRIRVDGTIQLVVNTDIGGGHSTCNVGMKDGQMALFNQSGRFLATDDKDAKWAVSRLELIDTSWPRFGLKIKRMAAKS